MVASSGLWQYPLARLERCGQPVNPNERVGLKVRYLVRRVILFAAANDLPQNQRLGPPTLVEWSPVWIGRTSETSDHAVAGIAASTRS